MRKMVMCRLRLKSWTVGDESARNASNHPFSLL